MKNSYTLRVAQWLTEIGLVPASLFLASICLVITVAVQRAASFENVGAFFFDYSIFYYLFKFLASVCTSFVAVQDGN